MKRRFTFIRLHRTISQKIELLKLNNLDNEKEVICKFRMSEFFSRNQDWPAYVHDLKSYDQVTGRQEINGTYYSLPHPKF